MNLTRRGLFKTLAAAFVAAEAAPLLPVVAPPPPPQYGINTAMIDELNRITLDTINPQFNQIMFATPVMFAFKGLGPVTFDGGDKITQSMIYEFWPPNPRKVGVIKNLG